MKDSFFARSTIEQAAIDWLKHLICAYTGRITAKVNALRELQSAGGEELSALMASVLDRAFKGEL